LIGSGDQEQIFCELREAVGLLRGRLHRIVELVVRAWPAQCELELRPQHREWGAQLVACVRHELPLVFERGF